MRVRAVQIIVTTVGATIAMWFTVPGAEDAWEEDFQLDICHNA